LVSSSLQEIWWRRLAPTGSSWLAGGLLTGLTATVLETALEAEMSEHLGYDKHDPVGREGGNSRNGTRTKTVLTEIGPVEVEVPRDRDRSFDPVIVRKRQRRLSGVDQIVLSLTARGLTTGEIAAHFADVYGAKVSKDTISRITDKVVEEMAEWRTRPLDRVYPVLFIDAIVRHEALCDRVEVKDLHRLAVAAAGLKLEAA
jgi:putative transposase